MGKASLEREIQELRKQLALMTEREASRAEAAEAANDEGLPDEEGNLSILRAKLEEFMGTLHQDLREIPATTAVGIFALGVLMGRLLPR